MSQIYTSNSMNKIAIIVLLTALWGACSTEKKHQQVSIQNDVDSASYSYGMLLAASLDNPQTDTLNLDLILEAIHNKKTTGEFVFPEEEARSILDSFFNKIEEEKAAKKKAIGEKFLTENRTKPGVKETDSGLQYIVMKEGNGPKPNITDKIRVHYTGTLLNGTEFDSSLKRGQPAEFPLKGRVIKGWTEGLQLMPVGSKYKFFIPSELAYGKKGHSSDVIGAWETLIFEIELLDIVK